MISRTSRSMIVGCARVGRLVFWVMGLSIIGHLSDIAIISVGGVGDMLGATIGKSNRVSTVNSTIGITCFSSIEGRLGVVISDSILIGVGSRSIGLGLMVGSGGVVRSWGRLVGRSVNHWSMVSRSRGVVCRSMDHRGVIGSRGRGMVGSRGMMDHWGVVGSSMVDHWGMIGSSMVYGMVSVSRVSWGVRGGDSCGGMDSGRVLLRVVVGVDTLGCSMGLAMYSGGIGTVGLVDRVTH